MQFGGFAISGLSTPWVACAVACMGVVLALHLLSLRRTRAVIHPGALVMRDPETHTHASRSRTLRRWLLAMVRALALGTALLAFDRPSLSSGAPNPVGAHRVIVLDVSASMGTPAGVVTRFERARTTARTLIEREDPARTPTALLLVGSRIIDAAPGFARNRAALLGALDRAPDPDGVDDLPGAIARARSMLDGLPGTIHVITDGQHPIGPELEGVALYTVDTSASPSNSAIVGLTWSPARPVVGDTLRVECALLRTGRVGTETVEITLGDLSSRVDAPAGERVVAASSFVLSPGMGGREIQLRASVDPDGFEPDNRAAATLVVREALRVRTIGPVGPLDRALAPTGARTRWDVKQSTRIDDLLAADAIVCAPDDGLDVTRADALAEAHRRGAKLLWVIRTPRAAAALGSWGSLRDVPIPGFVEAGDGDVRLRPVNAPRGAMPDTRDFLGSSDLAVRAPVSPIDVPSGWSAPVVDADGVARVLLRPGVAVLCFDPLSEGFARSPIAPILTHELVSTMLERGDLRSAVELFPPTESAPIPPGQGVRPERRPDRSLSGTGEGAGVELAPWLALGALVLLLIEPWIRQRGGG
ncbi:MAG: hypothetical protein Tsb0013_16290 [Phycisphaerales bacterium]